MKRALWRAAAATSCAVMPIAACTTLANSYSIARTPLERVDAAYTRIRIIGELAAIALPGASGADLHRWLDRADRALAAARLARDLEQLHHLQDLERAAAAIAAGSERVQREVAAPATPRR